MNLAHKIRLYPNALAGTYFDKAAGMARFAWNWALERWNEIYAAGEKPNWPRISREWSAFKKADAPWAYEVTKCASQQPIRNLGEAFGRFFKKQAKRPTFKKKGKSKPSFYLGNNVVKTIGTSLYIPKLGLVRMAEPLRFPGKIMSVTISKEADEWYASIQVQIDETQWPYPHRCENQASVGVDLGISSIVSLSDGTRLNYPEELEQLYEKVRRTQRSVSRKEVGSSNREKAKLVLSKLWQRIRRIRNDWAHKLTSWLVKNCSVIGLESLNIKGMMKLRSLARKIGHACWGEICRQLTYKSELAGSLLVRMDPFFPSSKLCSCCGHKLDKLPLSIRTWVCPACLTEHDRDTNAAVNIEKVAQGHWETQNDCGGDVRPMPVKDPATPLKQESSFLRQSHLAGDDDL